MLRDWVNELNEEKRDEFIYLLGDGTRRYTKEQKAHAINMVQDKGVRSTARILGLHRKTLQRWLRAEGIQVKRCPGWVYEWAYWRQKRQEIWKKRKRQ